MKRFKFQLETLLKVTRRKKDEAEQKFAEASRTLEENPERLQNMRALIHGEGKIVTSGVTMTYNNDATEKKLAKISGK